MRPFVVMGCAALVACEEIPDAKGGDGTTDPTGPWITAEEGGKNLFIVECDYAGLFTLQGVPEEAIDPIVAIEAPRLLFPFTRNIIADAIREGGFPPLLIQPIDFVSLYEQQMGAIAGEMPPQQG